MRIGIVGAGMIGSTVAKLWVDAGHEVRLASRHPEALRPLVESLGSRASVGTPAEAITFGKVVMLTVPLKAIPDLARDLVPLLAGKIVMDTGNAYEKRDGDVAREATGHPAGSAGWAAAWFPKACWVKVFNTVTSTVLESEAHRDGDRVGIPLAGDDREVMDVVAQLVRDAGFEPVPVGTLARGKEFEPGTRPYDTGMTGQDLRGIWTLALAVVLAAAGAVSGGCATDAAERDVSVAAPEITWSAEDPVGHHRLATLWGDFNRGQAGILLKLPGGFKSGVHAHTAGYRAVVISGTWVHVVAASGEGSGKELTPGSYWTQARDQLHSDECVSAEGCVFFRFSEAPFKTYTSENRTPK